MKKCCMCGYKADCYIITKDGSEEYMCERCALNDMEAKEKKY